MKDQQQNITDNLHPLPKGWVWTKIVEACQYLPTGVEEFEGKIEYYSTGSIKDTTYIPEGIYTFSERPSRANRRAQKGDILQARMAGTNKALLIGKELDGKLFSTGFVQLRPFNCCVGMSPYIYYYVQSHNFLIQRDALATGSTQVALTDNGAQQITFPLAPIDEQRRIVAKIEELLTKLDAGVKLLKEIQKQLKCYRQSVLKSAFEGKLTAEWREAHKSELESASTLLERIKEERKEKLGKKYKARTERSRSELPPIDTSELPVLPQGWVWTRVGEVADEIHYGYTESANAENIGPKFLRITDIQNNKVDWDTVPYCRIDDEKKEKYLLKEGDLVFARTGATVGKSFLIQGAIPESVFASYLIRIMLSDSINHKYVYSFFLSLNYWLQIGKGKLGIGQPNVNAQILSQIILPLPSKTEQHQIVSEIDRRFSIADQTEKTVDESLRQAERLRQSILKKAFEGKLVPQDPTDLPASVLLEQIKLEKEKKIERIKKRKR